MSATGPRTVVQLCERQLAAGGAPVTDIRVFGAAGVIEYCGEHDGLPPYYLPPLGCLVDYVRAPGGSAEHLAAVVGALAQQELDDSSTGDGTIACPQLFGERVAYAVARRLGLRGGR